MDRLVSELTVRDYIGLHALIMLLGALVVLMVVTYKPEWPFQLRLYFWGAALALGGIPIYFGLRVLHPGLPLV